MLRLSAIVLGLGLAAVYSRGALLLDALRRDLGDETFWRGVRD